MNRSARAAFSNADGSGICHVHSLFRRFAVEVFVVGLRVDAGTPKPFWRLQIEPRSTCCRALIAALIGFFVPCLINVYLGSQRMRRIGAVSGKELAMTLELLHKISKQTLPFTVTDLDEIDKLRVLRAAGHLAVLLPSCNAKTPFARVLVITKKGREALSGRDDTAG